MNREQALRCAEHVESELRKTLALANQGAEKTVVEAIRLTHTINTPTGSVAEVERMAEMTKKALQEAVKWH